jgi:hypothetical protein
VINVKESRKATILGSKVPFRPGIRAQMPAKFFWRREIEHKRQGMEQVEKTKLHCFGFA